MWSHPQPLHLESLHGCWAFQKSSVNCVTLNKKIGAINHIHIKRMNRVALLGISNEKAKRYRRQTTSVVHYPHYLKHVNKNPHGH